MRAFLALLLLAALCTPALAGHRHHCGHSGRGYYRYHHYGRYHAPRYQRYGCYPVYCGYGYGYGYYHFRPVLRFSHAYTRAFTVLTVDDEAFAGAVRADYDGVPEARTTPVGARFLQ